MSFSAGRGRWALARAAVAGMLAAGAALCPSAPVLAAHGTVREPVWAQAGYGPGNTGYNPDESMLTAGTVADLKPRWSRSLPADQTDCDGFQALPVVAGGRAFTSDRFGVYADDATSGRPLWKFQHDPPNEWAQGRDLAVVGDTLIVTIDECYALTGTFVYGLDVATGRIRWSNRMAADANTLVVDRGIAVVTGSDDLHPGEVSAFRITDGKRVWHGDDGTSVSPVSASGRLLLSRADRPGTEAIAIATGKQLWKTRKKWWAELASPAGNRLLVSDRDGNLLYVKASSGAVVWTAKVADALLTTDGQRVYAASGNTLTAYRVDTGRRLWQRTFADDVYRPIRAGDLLYATVYGQPMAILDPADGSTVASGLPFPGLGHYGGPIVVGGMIYTYDGTDMQAYGL